MTTKKSHTIYIKTEPGGHILFGKLQPEEIKLLKDSIVKKEISDDLNELRFNSKGNLNECDGVCNSGKEGDFGNEGKIIFDTSIPPLGPESTSDGKDFVDGVYVVLMKLSKCSIQFEFKTERGFDKNKFEEVSVPVKLPKEIVHGLYGHPDFNIISGFQYNGEWLDEYDGEVIDRQYDVQFTFFVIKGGKTSIIYSNFNGEESWANPNEIIKML